MHTKGKTYKTSSEGFDDSIVLCVDPVTEDFFQGVCISSSYRPSFVGKVDTYSCRIFSKEVNVKVEVISED